MADSSYKMIAGLGNPGEGYARTRHNIGFLVVEAIAVNASVTLTRNRFDANFARARVAGQETFLVKPMSYMNRSGFPIQKLAAYFKIPLSDIIVVHDEMDLPFGTLKIVQGRGHGGHNGVRSIIDAFGARDCIRVRVGVGHPGGQRDVTGHVLGAFSPEEQDGLDDTVKSAVNACNLILRQGIVRAMNRINTRR